MCRKFIRFFVYLIFLSAALPVKSQEFSFLSIDTSNFPALKAELLLSPGQGQKFFSPDPGADEFTITENGSSSLPIKTFSTETNKFSLLERNIIFVLDISGSMDERLVSGKSRFDVMKEAVASALADYPIDGRTAVAITAFGSMLDTAYSSWTNYKYMMGNGFLTDKVAINSTIGRMSVPRGGTNFNAPYFDRFDKYRFHTRSFPPCFTPI